MACVASIYVSCLYHGLKNLTVSRFVDRSHINESMYWKDKVSISNFWNNSLRDVLELDLVIILIIIILFLLLTLWLPTKFPPKYDNILHYSVKIDKINHFESGYVTVWIDHSNTIANTIYFRQNFVNMILLIYIFVKS
jgi:hypothetical protein